MPGDRLADAVHRGAYASAVDGVLINTHEQFATQFSAAKEDIGQVQILLSDAITQLMGSFDGMHNFIREQHEVILAMAGYHRGAEQADALKDNPEEPSELIKTLSRIKEAADTISAASKEIASGNTDLSQRTEEQAPSLEETAAGMEQLTSTVKQNAENAKRANQLALSASEIAIKGGVW